jgi:putative aldouronate transport system substrate-binding protein
MPKSYPGTEIPYIPSGQIIAVSDYIDLMPNFKASIEAWNLQEDLKTITQKDGKFYVLPGLHETFTGDYSFAVRSDILKELDIPLPDSWDDIRNMLAKMKEAYPDIYPWSDRWNLGMAFNIAGPAFGMGATGLKTPGANWNNNNCVYFDADADEYLFYPTMPEYREMLRFFAGLVKEGLLDPETVTQNDEQSISKFVNGKSLMIGTNGQALNDYISKMTETLGEGNFEVTRINVPAGPAGPYLAGDRLENGIMFAAKIKDDPNFESILKFVDWVWYSYSGQELCKWGIEGETFSFSDGKYELMPGYALPPYSFAKKAETDIDIRTEYGFAGGNFILSYGGPKQLQYSLMPEEAKAFNKRLNETRTLLPIVPPVLYDEDQLEAQNMIQQPLMDYVFAMTYKFVLGESDLDNDWDEYVKQCESKGSAKYIKTANEVYQETK